jgi:REP element-mobilizing transposase RayT
MPRQPRLDIPNILHHVIVRGIERRDIFADDHDKERFVSRLSEVLTQSATRCFAWALMSNHFHLLLMPTAVPLAQTMRRLLTGHAVYFNRRHKRSGHLFQNRYKSILCEEEPYFLELVRYIHLNPLRAGLVADIDGLESYPWSGHAVLIGKGTMAGQETDKVLARFGSGRALSRQRYRQFVADGAAQGRREELVGGGLKRSLLASGEDGEPMAYDERVLGSGPFVASMVMGNDGSPMKPSLSLDELVRAVCMVTGVDAERILRPSKERSLAQARALICCLAVQEFGYTGKDAGRVTGLGSAGASIAIKRGEELLKREPWLQDKILRKK